MVATLILSILPHGFDIRSSVVNGTLFASLVRSFTKRQFLKYIHEIIIKNNLFVFHFQTIEKQNSKRFAEKLQLVNLPYNANL